MQYGELVDFLQNVGKDPSRLIFEDELTGLHNRRFLHSYFEHKVRWETEESFPLSLMVMDIDLFKKVNDTFGHAGGDEALKFVAGLLKEIAAETGYAVRFGGDEFMVILPKTGLDHAVQHAHRLNQLTKERTLTLEGRNEELKISLSIGVASARGDAQTGSDLVRIADTALYTSKALGRNRVSTAAEIDTEKTSRKTALHRLQGAEIAGRSRELAAVSEALGALSLGKSCFVIFEGAPGMGKSTLIDTVRRSLASNHALHVVRIAGRPQEGFRAYYAIGDVIVAILNTLEDRGVSVLDELDAKEHRYLSWLLPHLEGGAPEADEAPEQHRQGLFNALVRLLTKLLDEKPLVLLIDELQYVDEASLVLLRVLSRQKSSLLVCGAVTEDVTPEQKEEDFPFKRFVENSEAGFPVEHLKLGPLQAADITSHLEGVFPGLEIPDGLPNELLEITQGNPLFLSEIIRKLVLDQKLRLEGQRWVLEATEPGYLPRSLEEIVTQKLAALDDDGRKLIEHVSTLGEDVPLSVVTGASEVSENKVLEFLDRAEDLGLLRSNFHINDETMRFLSKRVLDIVYGSMNESRREELHERIGTYQEDLNQEHLGTSASILAYHYKLSADREKATRYEQIRIDFDEQTFSRVEAAHYTGEPLTENDDEGPRDEKLEPEAIAHLPNLFRTMLTTIRSIQLYPPDSKPIVNALASSLKSVNAVLEVSEHVNLSRAHGTLLANGHKVDQGDFRLLANSYLEFLGRTELEGIDFRRGLRTEELESFLTRCGQLKAENIDSDYWKRFTAEAHLEHVILRQMRYSEIRKRAVSVRGPTSDVEAELEPAQLAEIPKLLRAILGASKNIKLYPLGSKPVTTSIDQLHEALTKIQSDRSALSLASGGDTLLVNGHRVNSSGYETLAESFVDFLAMHELTSLMFLQQVTKADSEAFIGALKDLPPDLEPSFWQELAKEKSIEGIIFSDRRYQVSVQAVLESVAVDAGLSSDPDDATTTELVATDVLMENLPTVAKDLLTKGDPDMMRKVLHKLFRAYTSYEHPARAKLVRRCRELMETLIYALQHQFAVLSIDYLILAFNEEDDQRLLVEIANLLHQMTSGALQFGDYGLASRIFSEIRERQRPLLEDPNASGRGFAVLNRKMDAATQALLMNELQSKEPSRQHKAAQVLESMGEPAIPLLIEVIKQEKDFRTRHLAASLLAKTGPEGAEGLKRDMVLEVTSEQRFRILEIVDIVTHDLKTELAFCLSDVNPKVRRAAFRLTERLNDKQVLELLVDFARHEDIGVAKGAIRSLANLQSAHAVGALVSTLEVTKEHERAIACAQALAQLGDAVAVPALEAVLTARKFPILGGKRWDDQVRATAAFALSKIGGERARAALRTVADDPDPRIRQIAMAAPRRRTGAPSEAHKDVEAPEAEGEDEGTGVA
ncbi:MAG: diguanylate cyclase [Acidobacteria bacterium]|nr:MAG: diguanylate cyclase [Acidobacteriota bacterium]